MKKVILTIMAGSLLLAACKKEPLETLTPGPDQIVYAISANNELISFNAMKPGVVVNKMPVSGIITGEKLMSIDFRPATGELYALSSASKLYIINQSTGVSRVVNTTAFTPALSGSIASIDFNPTVDRIRLVSNTGQNLRLNPETGTVAATDGAINGGMNPMIAGVAYTNSFAGASTTTLLDIDQATGKLYVQNPPNNGTLTEIGNLGINFTGNAAFDITPGNIALMAADNNFYLLDVNNGKASKIGALAASIIDIACPTKAVAYATDNSNNLIIFNPKEVAAGIVSKPITGLQAGENILGIDFRPLNGQLYALGSSNRLYTLNLSNGVATQVGTSTFSTSLLGATFGFDFNPTVDRIRVVSNLGQNLRLNPIDGTVAAVDGGLNPAIPFVSAAAYTNNFAGSATTTLFVIDYTKNKLMIQSPPNNGTLTEVGNIGVDLDAENGFDIGSTSNSAYLIATVGATTNLYTINTTSGLASAPTMFPKSVTGFSVGTGF